MIVENMGVIVDRNSLDMHDTKPLLQAESDPVKSKKIASKCWNAMVKVYTAADSVGEKCLKVLNLDDMKHKDIMHEHSKALKRNSN